MVWKLLIGLLLTIIFVITVILIRYPYLIDGIKNIYLKGHTTSYIDDFKNYPYVKIENANRIWEWSKHKDYNRFPLSKKIKRYHKIYGTVAYLVIKNDSILAEYYYDGYTADSLSNSFSMAKSITMSLVAKAVEEGYIGSLDDKVKKYLPGIQGPYANTVTIRDLAGMSGGTDWDEDYYSPFSISAESYFSDDLDKLMLERVHFVKKPGEKWFYSSGDTQFLGMIVRKATGKSLEEYLSEKFWKPMGMRREAYWNTDHENGTEKAFCCINSNARDFAKFGRLFLHEGNWNGRQLLDTVMVREMTRPHLKDTPFYGLQWWLFDLNGVKGFTMRGHLGQYVAVVPSEQLIMVRLGQRKPHSKPGTFADDFKVYLHEALHLARQSQ